MKLASSCAFALFIASANGFGQSSFTGTGVGVSTSSTGGMTMNIGGLSDLKRRQKFNNILKEVGAAQSAEAVQTQLLAPETSAMIEKCNWKLQKSMRRKVKAQAAKFDIEVDSSFGVSPTQSEREAAEQAASVENKKAKLDMLAAQAAGVQARKEAKQAKKAAKEAARAAAPAPAKKVEAPKEEAAPAPEPVAETAPAPAAATGGEVTPKTIKQLRDATGAGMMDCKRALLENDGDQDAAAEFLRAKGLAKADKKAARVAAEGKIAFASSGDQAVLVEVNCETDFVGKDSTFLAYCDKVAGAAVGAADVDSLMGQEVDGETLEATRQALVAKIGENIQVRRMAKRGGSGNTVGAYVHMNRIGVLVELEGGTEELAQDVAMHVAAMNPPFALVDDVPGDVVEKEKKFLTEQALESGKPPEIVEKMVEGRIRKYLEEIVLVSQNYVKDGDKTVGKYLESNGAKMVGFTRIVVGEGIEKREDDFAAEVASLAGASA